MAVTVDQLGQALRLVADGESVEEPHLSILTRQLGVADAFVLLIAPDAPAVVQDEARIRFASYLFDMPDAPRGDFYSAAWRNSGADSLTGRWQERRASVQAAVAGTVVAADGVTLAQVREEIATAIGELTIPPAYVLPAATSTARGGVLEVTNTVIDADTSTTVFGWKLSNVKHLISKFLPRSTQAEAGRVLAVGSDGNTFWDRALDAVVRGIGVLTGQGGKFLRVKADETGFEYADAPAGANADDKRLLPTPLGTAGQIAHVNSAGDGTEWVDPASAGSDATARAASAANADRLDNLDIPETFGLDHADVSLVKHLPATHKLTPSDTVRVYLVLDSTYAGLDSLSKWQALAWQVTATENNLRNAYRLLFRVPLADVDSESFARGYALHEVSGQPSLNEDFSKDVRTEQYRDGNFVYFVSEHYSVHVRQDGTGYNHTWRFQDYSIEVDIDAAHLAAAVLNRLLPAPTVGNKGKFAAIKPDGSAWEVVDAPGAAGIAFGDEMFKQITVAAGDAGKWVDSTFDVQHDAFFVLQVRRTDTNADIATPFHIVRMADFSGGVSAVAGQTANGNRLTFELDGNEISLGDSETPGSEPDDLMFAAAVAGTYQLRLRLL